MMGADEARRKIGMGKIDLFDQIILIGKKLIRRDKESAFWNKHD